MKPEEISVEMRIYSIDGYQVEIKSFELMKVKGYYIIPEILFNEGDKNG